MKLEASCTSSASSASSRLFIIDAKPGGHSVATPTGQANSFALIRKAYRHFVRGLQYYQARHRLATFRKHHEHLQDIGVSLHEVEGRQKTLDLDKLEVLLCCLYVTAWVADTMLRQRLSSKLPRWLRRREYPEALQGVFVLVHVCAYYVFGCRMQYSSRTAGVVSLHGLGRYALNTFC